MPERVDAARPTKEMRDTLKKAGVAPLTQEQLIALSKSWKSLFGDGLSADQSVPFGHIWCVCVHI